MLSLTAKANTAGQYGTLYFVVMVVTAGQWHALIDCYGQHRRPVWRIGFQSDSPLQYFSGGYAPISENLLDRVSKLLENSNTSL